MERTWLVVNFGYLPASIGGCLGFNPSIGYHVIGIGYIHAIQDLIANAYLPRLDVNMATYLIYEAKKRSEVAPGVGRETDVIIISNKGQQSITSEQLASLDRIYDSRRVGYSDDFLKSVSELPFNQGVK